jgi:membrane-bound serine protease (ClpP class)
LEQFGMSPWLKYLLFQIPGWVAASIIAILAVHWQWLTWSVAAIGTAVWVVKDLLLFPFLRRAYEPDLTGAARLVGERGVAEGDLTPHGYVRVRGELWRATANSVEQPLSRGTEVEVIGAEGMEVTVRAAKSNGEPRS